MIKILGSLFVLGGGALLWWFHMQARRGRRAVLSDLMLVLRNMQEEIRMTRMPLPDLFEKMAGQYGMETTELLRDLAAAAAGGNSVDAVWKEGVRRLPISGREQEVLSELSFSGDEEKVCKEMSNALYRLANCAEELDHSRAEEEKRVAALCFSGAALLVILLI